MQLRLHVSQVIHPFALARTIVEGIGIRINMNALNLPVDHTGNEILQLRVTRGK